MAKRKRARTLWIVCQIRATARIEQNLCQRTGCRVSNYGWLDIFGTHDVLSLRTSRDADEIRKIIWEVFPEADVRDENPFERSR